MEPLSKARKVMAEESVSGRFRNEGNQHYVSATNDLAPLLRMGRFQKALTCYENAFSSAKTDDELSSAAKNIAKTTWKLAGVSLEQFSSIKNGCSDWSKKFIHNSMNQILDMKPFCMLPRRNSPIQKAKGWSVMKFQYKQSLKNFFIAFTKGMTGYKPPSWIDDILASSRGCFEEFLTLSESDYGLNEHERVITVLEMIEFIPCSFMKADCMIDIAKFHFNKGVTLVSNKDFKGCLNSMRECYYPLNEAIRYGAGTDTIEREYRVLVADVNMQTGLAMAMQSLDTADSMFASVLQDEEQLNIDMIWEVIDWYKDSILKVRDLDIKQEAIALSRIGVVYDRVLKIKYKAKEYLKKSLELAHAITPFNVSNEKWYKDCTEVLDRYQKENLLHEQEEDRKKKAALLELLKPELDELKKHESDTYDVFLTFVYKKWPPKNPNHKLDLTKKDNEDDSYVKYKSLQKAVIHYHPDRVNAEIYGMKDKVLFEEITKCLTKRYEQIKSMK